MTAAGWPREWGPFLHLGETNPSGRWTLSALMVTTGIRPPFFYAEGAGVTVHREWIGAFGCHKFCRFSLEVERGAAESTLAITAGKCHRQFFVAIPGQQQPVRMAYFSCNGEAYDSPAGTRPRSLETLWDDMCQKHQKLPYHILIGGGDQIYCDRVFHLPALKKWRALDYQTRRTHPFTDSMKKQVNKFYRTHYLAHFSRRHFSTMLGSCPTIMTWDDHDIFDGWGSYNSEDQASPVFRGIFEIARRYYCLFQHHKPVSEWPDGGKHTLRTFGEVALMEVDTRSERTIDCVVPDAAWEEIFSKMRTLTSVTRHVIITLAIPVVYPDFALYSTFLEFFDRAQRHVITQTVFGRLGMTTLFPDTVTGSCEYLDDLRDHWQAAGHRAERQRFLERCIAFQRETRMRITILSGDVHCASFGETASLSRPDVFHDDRHMVQIVSSAIGYEPPPRAMEKLLFLQNAIDAISWSRLRASSVCADDNERVFHANRNWCEINLTPEQDLVATLHIENEGDCSKRIPRLKAARVIDRLRIFLFNG